MSHAQQPHGHQSGHAAPAPEPFSLRPAPSGGSATVSHATPARSATAHTASHGTAHGTAHGTVHGVAHAVANSTAHKTSHGTVHGVTHQPSVHHPRGNYHPLPVIGHAEAF